jgi:hypothetical protein
MANYILSVRDDVVMANYILSVRDDVLVNGETPTVTYWISRSNCLNLSNALMGVGCVLMFIEASTRACL